MDDYEVEFCVVKANTALYLKRYFEAAEEQARELLCNSFMPEIFVYDKLGNKIATCTFSVEYRMTIERVDGVTGYKR